ncbi:hypothetical protein AgCh_038147 [Apium graveolens]
MRYLTAIRYKGFGIPMDWMLDTGYVTQNEMKTFTTLIVDMVKKEKLFSSQGGPIILAQAFYGVVYEGVVLLLVEKVTISVVRLIIICGGSSECPILPIKIVMQYRNPSLGAGFTIKVDRISWIGLQLFLVQLIYKAAEGPNQDQEFNDLLASLRVSLKINYVTCKKALAKNINFLRVVVVKIDNFLEKRIVMNINDGGVDSAFRVNPVIQEDTQLLQELKKAQIEAFPEDYLYPNEGVVFTYPMTK